MSQFASYTTPKYKLYICVENTELREKYQTSISERITNNSTDSGFDLFLPEEIYYKPGQYVMIDHRIKCKMVIMGSDGDEIPTGYLLHPRSSTATKYNLMMANNTGVIDQDYRGNIKACMFSNWTEQDLKSHFQNNSNIQVSTESKLMKDTRIVQICSPSYRPFKIVIVSDLDDTSRGGGGFGSTGN
jgi:dUTP pyrophosphatase